jgi:predicted ATPase
MACRIVISGCSSGGKSTLLAALAARGHAVVEEPGRRVLRSGGPRPDVDLAGFLEACVALAVEDFASAEGVTFFDRGLFDALSGLDALGVPGGEARAVLRAEMRYAPVVLMTPPWPEIYAQDAERTHGFADAVKEYDRLMRDYARAGYRTQVLRRASVTERVAEVEGLVRQLRGWRDAGGTGKAVATTDGGADDPGQRV